MQGVVITITKATHSLTLPQGLFQNRPQFPAPHHLLLNMGTDFHIPEPAPGGFY